MHLGNFSYWEKETFFKAIDFAVIGGGIVGFSSAIYLKKKFPNARIVIFERDVFSAGASTKNAGFACIGSPGELLDDLQTMPPTDVFSLLERRFKGLLNLRELLGDKNIDYDPCGGFELFSKADIAQFTQCIDRIDFLNSEIFNAIGIRPYCRINLKEQSWPFQNIHSAIFNKAEGALNTGKMMHSFFSKAAEMGIIVLNGIPIEGVEESGNNAVLKIGRDAIHVGDAVVCTNGFAKNLVPGIEVVPARNQVLVTERIEGFRLSGTFHIDKGYVYFREIDGRILLGGKRNLDPEGEMTDTFGLTPNIQRALEELLQTIIFPRKTLRIEHRWSGILGLGPSKSTLMKSVSPHIHVGVRMGGMGVAIGSLVGKEVAEMLSR